MSLVRVATSGPVCTVTLCDTERRNALSARLVAEVVDAFERAEADDEVRAVVLTNEGTTFCAGADLSERAGEGADGPPVGLPDLLARVGRSPKPYVGRIAGHCVAGGMGLASAMDISVVDEAARFGFTEVRVGVAPAMISVVCLPKMRPADARNAFLRGRRFTGREAAEMGLVNVAVPRADLDREVGAVLDDVLAGGPEAMAWCKRLLAEVPGMPPARAVEWTSEVSDRLFRSDEAREGRRAFRERRLPSFARARGGEEA